MYSKLQSINKYLCSTKFNEDELNRKNLSE